MVWTNEDSAGPKKGVALGVIFRNIRFDEMLHEILGVKIPLAWMSEMTAGMCCTSVDLNQSRYNISITVYII